MHTLPETTGQTYDRGRALSQFDDFLTPAECAAIAALEMEAA